MLYRIILRPNPNFKVVPFDEKVNLNQDQLNGLVIMATSLLGSDRDRYFEIRDSKNQHLNLDQIIINSGAVIIDGEAAFEITPIQGRSWLNTILETAEFYGQFPNRITKKYTIKIDGSYPFVVQFDKDAFYNALIRFSQWLGQPPDFYLKYLHDGDTPVPIAR